jgi:8-oxo-dGTP pyrophosphatase MutT (NUDIX family)
METPPPPNNLFSDPVEVIPAATVVIFRKGPAGGPPELLMLQRARQMRFAGGAAVFPGGKVDPADRDWAGELAGSGADVEELAARIAAVRETLEEAGLLLALTASVSAAAAAEARAELLEEGALRPVLERRGWQLALDRLVPFARWFPRHRRSFDTRFYLHDIGTGAHEISVDATENTRLFWVSAAEALAQAERGELGIIFPTRCNLQRLAGFADYAAAEAHARAIPVQTVTPRAELRDGTWWIVIPDDAGYPVTASPFGEFESGATPVRAPTAQ